MFDDGLSGTGVIGDSGAVQGLLYFVAQAAHGGEHFPIAQKGGESGVPLIVQLSEGGQVNGGEGLLLLVQIGLKMLDLGVAQIASQAAYGP